ncbi:hypothetical protein FRB94_006926 [Tulasnella sp. JGI-2019a]|nr:hypothetical protein FRB94_006926 [Tulasnella sp. JGI-2019a]KAG9000477.1 hypothetical protein FRB93_012682 [Tulasnella sp. JGI-2019a]KAG9033131.1 hypothetical protein FRB95_000549 [Tulasnella sp. JGI-2019a]
MARKPNQGEIDKALDNLLRELKSGTEGKDVLHIVDDSPPSHDSMVVKDIDLEVDAILVAGQMLAATASARVMALRRTRAYLSSPIHHLSTELLTKVLHYASHPDGDFGTYDYVARLHALAQVCLKWATIARESPDLWTLVQSTSPNWESELKRAKRTKFGVKLDEKVDGTSGPFWSTVKAQSSRWESLEVTVRSGGTMDTLLTLSTPHLEILKIDITRDNNTHQLLSLCRDNLPKLAVLHLKRAALKAWNAPFMAGLRVLSLEQISTSGPSLSQLLDVVQACPELRHLKLDNVVFRKDKSTTGHPAILLRNLHSLDLVDLAPAIINATLRCLQSVDSLRNVHVRSLYGAIDLQRSRLTPRQRSASLLLPGRFLTLITPSFKLAPHSKITFDDDELFIDVEMPGSSWDLTIVDLMTPDILGDWLAGVMRARSLDQTHPGIDFITTLPLFNRLLPHWNFAHVQSLVLQCSDAESKQLDDFCIKMSAPTRVADDVLSWQCPALRSLELQGCQELDADIVLEMVRSRINAVALPTAAPDEAPLSARLEDLRLTDSYTAGVAVEDVEDKAREIMEASSGAD